MFEDKTYENIMSEMLSHINGLDSELDTRVGSLIYNAVAPIALELETAYHEMDMILAETFLETASKEYLVKHAEQIGLSLIEATNGHYKGEFNVDVEVGSRFNLDKFNYNVVQKLSSPTADSPYYVCELVCETVGSEPNGYLGDLTPITYIANLYHAELVSVISYGEDEEDTEDFRERIQSRIKNKVADGNVAQYEAWLDEYPGIGKYKIVPRWNGVNTIKLLILNSDNKSATAELVDAVQEYFDPATDVINDDTSDTTYPQGRGMGNGQASIGAIVTVDTVIETPVTINCTLVLKDGYTSPTGVQDGVIEYLDSLVLNKTTVAYMPISAAIYNAESVEDITSLTVTVNGTVMDINADTFIPGVTLSDTEIPVLDTTNCVWGV